MRLLLLVAFTLSVLSSTALAQEPTAGAEPGAALKRAVSAYDAGDWQEARRWFEQAHSTAPTARTLRGLGVVAYRQDRLVDAYAYLTRSLVSNAKPLTEELRASVLTLLNELASKLTRVHFQLHPAGAELRIDGDLPSYDASGAVLVMPGNHRATLAAPGHVASEWKLEAQAGLEQLRSWQLALEPSTQVAPAAIAREPSAATVTTPAGPDAQSSAPGERSRRLRRWGYGAVAATAAALVVTAVAIGLGVNRVRAIESSCKKDPDGGCTPTEADAAGRERKLPLLSGLAIGGGVLAGVGAVATIGIFVAARPLDRAAPERATFSAGIEGAF